ncbi:hypothetical protein QT973_19365 [Microcoleus sp. Z1_A1]|uniref:hypothetical protein n=1 Tax=Microcoleus sp. Z1_A1 TaxID=3055428 RepID=UPI002FD320A0
MVQHLSSIELHKWPQSYTPARTGEEIKRCAIEFIELIRCSIDNPCPRSARLTPATGVIMGKL